jgi:hypothetical protein
MGSAGFPDAIFGARERAEIKMNKKAQKGTKKQCTL